jgi:hypothetical protein
MAERPYDQHEHESCMDPRHFLDHGVRVHQQRQALVDAFARKEHWIFAMCPDCRDVGMKLAYLYAARHDGEAITLVAPCCLEARPAFFLFPKKSLAFHEIGEILDIELAVSQDEAASQDYFMLTTQDPAPLSALLDRWLYQDHLLS